MSNNNDTDNQGNSNNNQEAPVMVSAAGIGSSPGHIMMAGPDFSAQELHELLGGVLGDAHPGVVGATSYLSYGGHGGGGGGSNSSVGGDNNGLGEDKAVARTERKRSREKQRRCDVNRQFTELTTAVRRIESEAEELRAPTLYSPSNRADLIARTVSLLEQLHESNKRRKIEVTELQDELQQAKKAGEDAAAKLKESMMAPHNVGGNRVLMMVPMMIGGDGSTPNNPAANMGGAYGAAAAGMQFMMPQPTPVSDQQSRAAANVAQYAQQPDNNNNVNGAVATNNNAPMGIPTPWGMMPQWMMQNMITAPADLSMNNSGNGNDKKAAGIDSSSSPVGSNLAHCA